MPWNYKLMLVILGVAGLGAYNFGGLAATAVAVAALGLDGSISAALRASVEARTAASSPPVVGGQSVPATPCAASSSASRAGR